jgi:hypothetical protein
MKEIGQELFQVTIHGSCSGLPDFSWYMILKTGKNVPNEHKMYQMVIKYPKRP